MTTETITACTENGSASVADTNRTEWSYWNYLEEHYQMKAKTLGLEGHVDESGEAHGPCRGCGNAGPHGWKYVYGTGGYKAKVVHCTRCAFESSHSDWPNRTLEISALRGHPHHDVAQLAFRLWYDVSKVMRPNTDYPKPTPRWQERSDAR